MSTAIISATNVILNRTYGNLSNATAVAEQLTAYVKRESLSGVYFHVVPVNNAWTRFKIETNYFVRRYGDLPVVTSDRNRSLKSLNALASGFHAAWVACL